MDTLRQADFEMEAAVHLVCALGRLVRALDKEPSCNARAVAQKHYAKAMRIAQQTMETKMNPEDYKPDNDFMNAPMGEPVSPWMPFETAPKDGSQFIAACFDHDDEPEYEVGSYKPFSNIKYSPVNDGSGLFRAEQAIIMEFTFNNEHRMTHWSPIPLPLPPNAMLSGKPAARDAE